MTIITKGMGAIIKGAKKAIKLKKKDPPITKQELQELDDRITDRQISMSYKSSKSFGDEVRKTKGAKLTKRGRKK